LFELGGTSDGVCSSQCSTCGTLCAAFPITDLNTLTLYKTKGCTTIVGDLYIMNLPSTVGKQVLFDNLRHVQYIRGGLYVENNAYLNALTFFSNLFGVDGVYYSNMPILVDAQMPSLIQQTGNVTVVGCNRLCPARYTAVGVSTDETGCADSTLALYLYIVRDATLNDVYVLANVTSRLFMSATNGKVCNDRICS